MVNISRIYFGLPSQSDHLRYEEGSHKRPVIVWNIEGRCNLGCVHCYASARKNVKTKMLTPKEARTVLQDLAEFSVPVILFSGGEPLLREDIFELLEGAARKGIRAVLSTNGTLITDEVSQRLEEAQVSYVGISLDGDEAMHDSIRGMKGAFRLALKGIRNLQRRGIKTGLRFTLTQKNYLHVPSIFRIAEEEGIGRICFYHLVYSGRGKDLIEEDLSPRQRREVLDFIVKETGEALGRGHRLEVLTVDNHADGPYLFLKLLKENRERAFEALKLLSINGGNQSGVGIAAIDEEGNVHPDQFLREVNLGNVKEKPFSEIWRQDGVLKKFREKRLHVKGRCGICGFLHVCGGNFRARALAVFSDLWAEDPQCYLTQEEIRSLPQDREG